MSWPDAANLGVGRRGGRVVSMQDSIGARSFIVWGFRTGPGFVFPLSRLSEAPSVFPDPGVRWRKSCARSSSG